MKSITEARDRTVDYPADTSIRFDFSKTAILFDKATGRNCARGTITLA